MIFARRRTAILVLALVATPAAAGAQTTAPYLAQDSMNVFRRFSVEREKMLEFYGTVLGLAPMPTLALGGTGSMSRFKVGTSEIKLTNAPRGVRYNSGEIRDVGGLRVWTFFFPDAAALTARFVEHGYAAPQFATVHGGSERRALVRDPDGQWVELVIASGASAETFSRIEVGLTVSDIEKSRGFYREFVGLEELPAVQDPLLMVTKYPFRHGTTTINLWSFGTAPPTNGGAAGIQYVVSNVDAVNALAETRHVKIDQPLRDSQPGLRTVWLADPDGITNYYAETARSRSRR